MSGGRPCRRSPQAPGWHHVRKWCGQTLYVLVLAVLVWALAYGIFSPGVGG